MWGSVSEGEQLRKQQSGNETETTETLCVNELPTTYARNTRMHMSIPPLFGPFPQEYCNLIGCHCPWGVPCDWVHPMGTALRAARSHEYHNTLT